MKRILLSVSAAAVITSAAFISCKKGSNDDRQPSYECSTCVSTPDAKAANDGISKGVYKGILIGSTGTIKFDIANNGSTITATMVIDGTTVNLTSNVTWTNGVSYTAPFTGTFSGQPVTINFTVGFNGTNPEITSSSIPGHPNAVFDLIKENSNMLIECFEGTYSTSKQKSGTFNIILSRSAGIWGGVSRENNSTESESIEGKIDASGNIKNDDGDNMGKLSGDNLSGKFKDNDGVDVQFSGKRTL